MSEKESNSVKNVMSKYKFLKECYSQIVEACQEMGATPPTFWRFILDNYKNGNS